MSSGLVCFIHTLDQIEDLIMDESDESGLVQYGFHPTLNMRVNRKRIRNEKQERSYKHQIGLQQIAGNWEI